MRRWRVPAGKAVVTGYPVRRQFGEATREEGRAASASTRPPDDARRRRLAGGAPDQPRVLARSRAARARAGHPRRRARRGAWLRKERERLPAWLKERYHLHAYTEEMAYAMAAADLAVMRAGASTIGELPVSRAPGDRDPGRFSDQHGQRRLPRRARRPSPEHDRDRRGSATLMLELIEDEQRARMASAMRALAQPGRGEALAALVLEVAADGALPHDRPEASQQRRNGNGIPKRVHLVGAGGIHMSAIGQILLQRGHSRDRLRPHALRAHRRLEALGGRVFAATTPRTWRRGTGGGDGGREERQPGGGRRAQRRASR
jgi:hypothetical protein